MRNNRPMPVYERIKSDILENIDQGLWRPGDRIPSEHELVRQFGVSRMTVNRAMRELTDAGRILRIPGTGSFVAQPDTDSSLLDIQSVDEYIAGRGGRHKSELLRLDRVAAEWDLATRHGETSWPSANVKQAMQELEDVLDERESYLRS